MASKKSNKWMQKAFKPSTRGLLTKKAKRAGYKSAMSFARHVLRNKGQYDSRTVHQAQAAVNAQKSRGRK